MTAGVLAPGSEADVCIFDPDRIWTVEPADFASKGKNTPLAGQSLRGRVVATICRGDLVYLDEQGRSLMTGELTGAN